MTGYDVLFFNVRRQFYMDDITFGDSLGIHLLAAFLAENGYESRVYVGYAHEVENVLRKEVPKHGVRAVGFYCDYDNLSEVRELSRYMKEEYGLAVIIGGPQAIALNKEFLEYSQCDVVVRGEGELPLLEVLNCIFNGSGSLTNIRGISFMEDGELVRNPDQELIRNLDALPTASPRFSLNRNFRKKSAAFLTGRGCPFSCAFCYEGHNSRTVRLRSVENVLAEIDQVLADSPDIRYFFFTDDTFTLDVKRVYQFCEEFKKRRLKRDFVWFCEGHVRTLARHPEMLRWMAEAGLIRLQIGIESGCQRVLDLYHKQTTLEEIEFVIKEAVKCGISQVVGNFIVGGAGETKESLEESMAFAEKLHNLAPGVVDLRTVYFWPFPNTPMTSHSEKYGMHILDIQSDTSMGDYPVVETPTLTRQWLCEFKELFDNKLLETMRRLRSSVPYEQIYHQFEASERYNADSLWHRVFSEESHLQKYFTLLVRGAGKRSVEVGEKLLSYHPVRTVHLLHHEGEALIVQGEVLTKLETEVLRHLSGRLNLREIIDKLYTPEEGSREQFMNQVLTILKGFEDRYWVLYSRF